MRDFLDRIIEWSFYLLFFLVPLWFYAGSSELFEYNKMMLTYGLTIIIVTAWLAKMILAKKIIYRRTFLEIPLLLYLASHILSTLFSIDPHTSIWGYYSRFHEGLLASISYILLYFAAVSNLQRIHVLRVLLVSFFSGGIVSVYGAFEHFGHSTSCLLITGKFNVDCWVQDVQGRVFATLGQPNWMAAYLDVLIVTTLGFALNIKREIKPIIRSLCFITIATLFFLGLIYTKSRSGEIGLLVSLGILQFYFLLLLLIRVVKKFLIKDRKTNIKEAIVPFLYLLLPLFLFLTISLVSLFTGDLPINSKELAKFLRIKPSQTQVQQVKPAAPSGYIDIGISESGDIRKVVWTGAIKIWQRYPIFGSGVETFAYAYYQDRPVEHNMLSEWDFLYNKAHNEYLNILATTGSIGFLAYLSIIVTFIFWVLKFTIYNLKFTNEFQISNFKFQIALFAAWVSILVTNFFGFSVVIIGLFFFLIPAFCLILSGAASDAAESKDLPKSPTIGQWLAFIGIGLISLNYLLGLFNMWQADKNYAYGKNLDSVQQYVQAYPYLKNAVDQNTDEPTFRDELSSNEAVLASAIFNAASGSAQEKLQAVYPQFEISAQNMIDKAVSDSDQVVAASPNVMPFWKTRTRMFYQLATIDPKFNLNALAAIQQAAKLAPTDAKVHYNLGILLGRTGQVTTAIKTLEETVAMKADYRDAYYALALYQDQTGDHSKARQTMGLILSRIGPDTDAQKWLDEHK